MCAARALGVCFEKDEHAAGFCVVQRLARHMQVNATYGIANCWSAPSSLSFAVTPEVTTWAPNNRRIKTIGPGGRCLRCRVDGRKQLEPGGGTRR